MTAEEATIPSQFTHSIKLEQTAKGIRVTVHVYANDRTEAITQAFSMYSDALNEAKLRKILVAPMEIEAKK